jgi:hypothetical protein
MWDVPVITDQTILVNHPDVVLHGKKGGNLPADQYRHTR